MEYIERKLEELRLAVMADTALDIIEDILFYFPKTKVEDLSWEVLNSYSRVLVILEAYNAVIINNTLMYKLDLTDRTIDCSRIILNIYKDFSNEIKARITKNSIRSLGERYRQRMVMRLVDKTKE